MSLELCFMFDSWELIVVRACKHGVKVLMWEWILCTIGSWVIMVLYNIHGGWQ